MIILYAVMVCLLYLGFNIVHYVAVCFVFVSSIFILRLLFLFSMEMFTFRSLIRVDLYLV